MGFFGRNVRCQVGGVWIVRFFGREAKRNGIKFSMTQRIREEYLVKSKKARGEKLRKN